jgi:hypothetical protein
LQALDFLSFSPVQVYFGGLVFAEIKGNALAVPTLFESKMSVNPQNPVG